MMEGTYYKEWSAVLDREMEFKVYGHGGVPVLALPARGGRFYDWENNGMPDAAARLLHEGKIQLFCADSIDGESLLAGNETPRRRAEMQEKYFVYLTSELAARIAELNAPESKEKPLIWCVGVDTGAYQAVQCRLRRPRTFAGAMGLSGLYDMNRFLGSGSVCQAKYNASSVAAPSPPCTRTASATRMFCPRPRRTVCCSAWVRAAMRAMPSLTPRLWPTP